MRNRTNGLAWGLFVWALIAAPWLVLGLVAASRLAATMDEIPHFGAGLSYLEHGDFRMNPEHPPLVKVLAALPVWLIDPPEMTGAHDPGLAEIWAGGHQHYYGHHLLYHQPDDRFQRRLMLARLGPLAIGLAGGLLAFFWGRELSRGNPGGWAAAALLLYYPEYLGHAGFVAFDVPMLVACGAIAWTAWCWWRRPTARRALALAAVCAVGSLVKLPVALFAALQCATLVALAMADRRSGMVARAAAATALVVLAGIGAAWAGAGFRFSALAPGTTLAGPSLFLGPYDPKSDSSLTRLLAMIHHARLLPESTLAVLAHLTSFSERYQMLFGEVSPRGWRHYFLVTTVLKTPLPMLVGLVGLLVLAAGRLPGAVAGRGRRVRTARWVVLLVPFLGLALLLMESRVNIGHRHFLAVYFPWCVALGAWAGPALLAGGRITRGLAIALVASQVITTLWVFPHQSTYINLLGQSPYRASTLISDSNVDWGQDLPLLADWMREHGIERVNLAYFGTNRPEAFGIRDFNWIIANSTTFIDPPLDRAPDPRLPTAISLFNLPFVRKGYPELYAREPDVILNSIVIYEPDLFLP